MHFSTVSRLKNPSLTCLLPFHLHWLKWIYQVASIRDHSFHLDSPGQSVMERADVPNVLCTQCTSLSTVLSDHLLLQSRVQWSECSPSQRDRGCLSSVEGWRGPFIPDYRYYMCRPTTYTTDTTCVDRLQILHEYTDYRYYMGRQTTDTTRVDRLQILQTQQTLQIKLKLSHAPEQV